MSNIFDDSDDTDEEIKLQTNNDYAKNYDTWRKKELLNGLKTKYGDINPSDEDDTSGSDDDEDEPDFSPEVELKFLKTLSSLKRKDPNIYNEKVQFFDDNPIDPTVKKKQKAQKMYLKDYERKMLLSDQLEDEEEQNQSPIDNSPTYVQEQASLKQNLKQQLDKVDEEAENFLKTRVKSVEDASKEEADYKQWLKGERTNLVSESQASDLKTLKDYWDDPNLESGEKFLRDYILHNRFREANNANYVPTYEEIVHDDVDGENVDRQEQFEHKFNYRYEEPDQEFLKRYPRTMEHSLRKTDDRRKIKRNEVKERKILEKQAKMAELQKMKELKRLEIEEKIKKLKEITGNTEVAFEINDFDDEFNPDEHDKRMHALFNEEFYEGEEGDEKPEFPHLDDELELERWDKHNKDKIIDEQDDEPHAEDADFNMDCDYDPEIKRQDKDVEGCKRRKRRRKSKFAEVVSATKPLFDPNDKSYEEYLDEYYKLDCEDIVGGIPCRFKYRKVAENSFGLTVEEILNANDKELNRWCSIKKALQHRPDHVEKYDQIAFTKKAQNEALKRKILPSLYVNELEGKDSDKNCLNSVKKHDINPETITNKKRKRNLSEKSSQTLIDQNEKETKSIVCHSKHTNADLQIKNEQNNDKSPSKKIKQKEHSLRIKNEALGRKNLQSLDDKRSELNDSLQIGVNFENKKDKNAESKKGKKRKRNSSQKANGISLKETQSKIDDDKMETGNVKITNAKRIKKKPKAAAIDSLIENDSKQNNHKLKQNLETGNQSNQIEMKSQSNVKKKKGQSSKQSKQHSGINIQLSDARLKAFGIKPKKFKNKLKYGHKKK